MCRMNSPLNSSAPCARSGGTPFVETRHTRVGREHCCAAPPNRPRTLARDIEMFRMKKMQAYIAIRGSDNASENSDVPSDRMPMYSRIIRPVLNYRVNKTRWCVLRWPTPSMAQAAGMSTEAFENLYFDVCTMNYRKMARAMVPLERRMKQRGPRSPQSPGHRSNVQHQGHRREDVQGRPQHSRWRGVFLPGEEFRERRAFSSTRQRFTPERNLRTSGWNSRTARSSRPRPTTQNG